MARNAPTHAHINLYANGATLGPHADDEELMMGGRQPTMIISESRGAPYVINFRSKKHFTNWITGQTHYDYEDIILPDRSILIMKNLTQTSMFHSVRPAKPHEFKTPTSLKGTLRNLRINVTFRWVNHHVNENCPLSQGTQGSVESIDSFGWFTADQLQPRVPVEHDLKFKN